MQIGDLRYRINLLVPNVTRDASGQETLHESEPYRRHLRKLPAKFVEVGGGEAARAGKVEASTTAVFQIRYLRGVEKTMRIELIGEVVTREDGSAEQTYRYFDIVKAGDRDGKRFWLTIEATEVT